MNCYYSVPGTHRVFQPLCRLYNSDLYSRNYFYILVLLKGCGLFTEIMWCFYSKDTFIPYKL